VIIVQGGRVWNPPLQKGYRKLFGNLNWDFDSDNHLDKEIHELELTEIGG
jgi:hypothetical protein